MEEQVLAKDLVVGDIVLEDHGTWKARRLVVSMNSKSAVVREERNGSPGRIQLVVKRKRGKEKYDHEVEVTRIGHYDLTEADAALIHNIYQLGERDRELFKHGLLPGFPSMYAFFGYAPGEGPERWGEEPTFLEDVRSTENPSGNYVRIAQQTWPSYVDGKRVETPCFSASVMDGEHNIFIGLINWRCASREVALEAADVYIGKHHFDGWDHEHALYMARESSKNLEIVGCDTHPPH